MATKGKTVGVWLPGDAVDALKKALIGQPYLKDGTYCAEAVQERLRRDGHLQDSSIGRLSARAIELSRALGEEAFERALDEIASRQLETVGAGK